MRTGWTVVAAAAALVLAACASTPAHAPPPSTAAAPPARGAAARAAVPTATATAPSAPGRRGPASHSGSNRPRTNHLRTNHPRTNHCAHNTVAQRVMVSLRRQRMWLCAGHHTVESNPITSGMVGQWTNTPTGDYWIQGRTRDTVLTLNTGATYAVKYWIPFDGPLFGFHDASWQNFPFGSAKYKTQGSHGCVHMPLRAIAFLYRWAAEPTAVHIAA